MDFLEKLSNLLTDHPDLYETALLLTAELLEASAHPGTAAGTNQTA